MRTRVLSAACLGGVLTILCLSAAAQEPKKPLPANVVPATFRALLITDNRFPPVTVQKDGKEVEAPDPRNRTGKIHCLVCENGLAPVVAIFVRTDPKNVGPESQVIKLVKKLDAMIPQYRGDKLAGFVMFLSLENKGKTVKIIGGDGKETSIQADEEFPDEDVDKRDQLVQEIQGIAKAVNVPYVPFGLAAKKSEALTAWGVKPTDDVTVVVYYRMRKVGENRGFAKDSDLNDGEINKILDSVKSAIIGKNKK